MTIDYNQINADQLWFPVLPSAARTATPNQQQFSLMGDVDALALVINMSAVTSTGSVTVKVEGVDPVSQATYPILTSAAISTVSTVALRVHPNLPASANLTAQDFIPPIIRITATHGNSVSMTYSITALIPD